MTPKPSVRSSHISAASNHKLVVTFPPDGNYGHPDHIAVGQFTNAAIVCAADASYQDPENLPAYRVSKLYYMVDGEGFINLVEPFMSEMDFPIVDGQQRGQITWKNWLITTRIEMAEHCQTALRAIRCHESQTAFARRSRQYARRCHNRCPRHARDFFPGIQFGEWREKCGNRSVCGIEDKKTLKVS